MTTKELATTAENQVEVFKNAVASGDMSLADNIAAFMETMGLKVVAKGSDEGGRDSRIARQRSWQAPKKLEGEELALVESLPQKIGMSPVLTEARTLTQTEIDDVAEEMISIRPAQDILEGRKNALRETVFTAITEENGGDDMVAGKLVSVKHGYKLEKRISQRAASINTSALEELVDRKVWLSVTKKVETRQIDDDALTQAIAEGKIDIEVLMQVTVPGEKTVGFYPAPLKKGEEV